MSRVDVVRQLGRIIPDARFGTCAYNPEYRESSFQKLVATLISPAAVVESAESGCRIWPTNVVGSVTHKAGIMAVATSTELERVGIDLERVDQMLIPAVDYVMPEGVPSGLPIPLAVNLGFSLKEAVFKALSTTPAPVSEFSDVRLEFAGGSVRADTILPLVLDYAVSGRWILSVAYWPG